MCVRLAVVESHLSGWISLNTGMACQGRYGRIGSTGVLVYWSIGGHYISVWWHCMQHDLFEWSGDGCWKSNTFLPPRPRPRYTFRAVHSAVVRVVGLVWSSIRLVLCLLKSAIQKVFLLCNAGCTAYSW